MPLCTFIDPVYKQDKAHSSSLVKPNNICAEVL